MGVAFEQSSPPTNMGKDAKEMINMDQLVDMGSVLMPGQNDGECWDDDLKAHTACVCCDCSFFIKYPNCCGCREVGTCLCCSGARMMNVDWKEMAFCCQAVSVAYCIDLKACKDPGCMQAIWGQEAGQATCCFIFHSKYKGACHMIPLKPSFICCKVGEQCLCIDQRFAIPCDKDVPLEVACCGKYCVEKHHSKDEKSKEFHEYKCGGTAACNDTPCAEEKPAESQE